MTNLSKHWKSRLGHALRSASIFVMVAFMIVAFVAALYGPDYFRDP